MNTFNKGEPENPGRRGFFGAVGKVVAVAGAAVIGVKAVKEVNKYSQREQELNNLHESLKGQESNPSKAVEMIDELVSEMNKANPPLEKVRLSGTGTSNDRIDVIRDFLTSYINSSVGRSHYFGDDAIASGVYTRENLVTLREKSSKLAEK